MQIIISISFRGVAASLRDLYKGSPRLAASLWSPLLPVWEKINKLLICHLSLEFSLILWFILFFFYSQMFYSFIIFVSFFWLICLRAAFAWQLLAVWLIWRRRVHGIGFMASWSRQLANVAWIMGRPDLPRQWQELKRGPSLSSTKLLSNFWH